MLGKLIVITTLALGLCVPPVHALTITHTQPRRMASTSFVRLGDFLGCHSKPLAENNPTRFTLLTNRENHNGLFFEAELDTPVSKLPEGSTVLLELLLNGDRTAREFKFTIPATHSHARAIYLGVTEDSFADISKSSMPHILAWKISILDFTGKVLASSPSALWQK